MTEHINRRINLAVLFDDFIAKELSEHPGETLHGIDRKFAAKLEIHHSSLSLYKNGNRPMGPRVARQIEAILKLPLGWMDESRQTKLDEVALNRFLKLARRFYLRATNDHRQVMTQAMEQAIEITHT